MSAQWKPFWQTLVLVGCLLLAFYFLFIQLSLGYKNASLPIMSGDEKSLFLNFAVIGGTLLALSFVTLSFFLGDLIKRYESTALPVFRDQEPHVNPHENLLPPHSLKDVRLFDGDPLVIFLAFSVAVTWIQFLVPLTIGLTVGWGGANLPVLADELAGLLAAFSFSFKCRNNAVVKLKPYLTRDELFWPVLGRILLSLYLATAAIALISAFSEADPLSQNATIWGMKVPGSRATSIVMLHLARFLSVWFPNALGCSPRVFGNEGSLFCLKLVCILSLLLGTYTTNKDMFIFFKSRAAERMRLRWLSSFVHERYRELKCDVQKAGRTLGRGDAEMLIKEWNDGVPPLKSAHKEFKEEREKHLADIWRHFIEGRSGLAIWLLDVPLIANWEEEVRRLVKRGPLPANADSARSAMGAIVAWFWCRLLRAAYRGGVVVARVRDACRQWNLSK